MKKSLVTLAAGTISLAAILALGGLSFIGMYSILPLIPICAASFFLATFVEGQVYWQNLVQAIRSLSFRFDANYTKKQIVRRYLKKIAGIQSDKIASDLFSKIKQEKNLEDLEDNVFLVNYIKQSNYVKKLKENHAHKELAEAEERLEKMESFFLDLLDKNASGRSNQTEMEEAAIKIIESKFFKNKEIEELKQELRTRPRWLRVGYLFALAAGISTGLATISAFQAGLIAIGAASAIPGGAIIALGIFSAIGYTLLMYQAIMDMLASDKITRYWQQVKTYSQRREKESYSRLMLRRFGMGLVVALVVGLAIFATAATAGTWWYAAEEGLNWLGKLPTRAAALISQITTIMWAIPTLIFNIVNSLPSTRKILELFASKLKVYWQEMKINIKHTWQNEVFDPENPNKFKLLGLLRFINPFRLLSKILTEIFFLGHLISIGAVSAEGLPGVPRVANMLLASPQEALTDWDYLFGHEHTQRLKAMEQKLQEKEKNNSNGKNDQLITFLKNEISNEEEKLKNEKNRKVTQQEMKERSMVKEQSGDENSPNDITEKHPLLPATNDSEAQPNVSALSSKIIKKLHAWLTTTRHKMLLHARLDVVASEEDDDDHDHEGWLMKIIQFPIYLCKLLSFGWDWVMSGFEDRKVSQLKTFPHYHMEVESPELDPRWSQQEILFNLQQKQDALNGAWINSDTARKKVDALGDICTILRDAKIRIQDKPKLIEGIIKRDPHVLKTPRYGGFFKGKNSTQTESFQLAEAAAQTFTPSPAA